MADYIADQTRHGLNGSHCCSREQQDQTSICNWHYHPIFAIDCSQKHTNCTSYVAIIKAYLPIAIQLFTWPIHLLGQLWPLVTSSSLAIGLVIEA